MFEPLKNLLLASLGAAVITKEKAMGVLDQMVEQGRMSYGEAEQMADELVSESKRQAQAMSERVNEQVKKAMDGLSLCRREELIALEGRVAQLELQVAALTKDSSAGKPTDGGS